MAAPRVTLLINGKRHVLKWDRFAHAFVKVFDQQRPGNAPYVLAQLYPVHVYRCRGRRGDPCNCGAHALFDAHVQPPKRKRQPAKPRHGAPDWDR